MGWDISGGNMVCSRGGSTIAVLDIIMKKCQGIGYSKADPSVHKFQWDNISEDLLIFQARNTSHGSP